MTDNNLSDLNCPECRAGLAQLAQMDLAFRCEDHGVIRIDMQVIGRQLADTLREVTRLQAEIVRLGYFCGICHAAPGESCACPGRGV